MPRKIGFVGGLSPQSTIDYYAYLVKSYFERFGDEYYPEIVIYSVSFQKFAEWSKSGRWDKIREGLVEAVNYLAAARVEVGFLSANTVHRVFDEVQKSVEICLISIVEEVGKKLQEEGVSKVGLLGTKFTMTDPKIYFDKFKENGVEVIVPDEQGIEVLNQIIYSELARGIVKPESKTEFLAEIIKLSARGAQGVILGCTEIPLIVKQEEIEVRLYDSLKIHADKVLEYATNP